MISLFIYLHIFVCLIFGRKIIFDKVGRGGAIIRGMEKQPHKEYRDELAKELKDLRSGDIEDKENSKLLLNIETGTPEYKNAKKTHLAEIQEKMSQKDEQIRSLSAEERLDYIYKNSKIEGLDKVSTEEVLKTLKLIDELREIGFRPWEPTEEYIDSSFYYFKQRPNIFPELGSKDDYDIGLISVSLNKINRELIPHKNTLYRVLPKTKFSNADHIVECTGSHGWANAFTLPAKCECEASEGGIGIEERAKKFYDFIQRFRKS